MPDLSDLMHALPHWQCVQMTPLSGGLTNACQKITWQCRESDRLITTVWRPCSEITQLFRIDRQNEWAILQQLSSVTDLSPQPICQVPSGILVSWLEGEPPKALSQAEILSVLVSVHRLPLLSSVFSFDDHIQHYLSLLSSAKRLFYQTRLSGLRRPQWGRFGLACCHHDLGAHNLVQSDKLKVIDWEYAAASDPAFELALMCVAHDWSVAETAEIYCQLSQRNDPLAWQSAISEFLPWAQTISDMWFDIMASSFPSQ